MMSQSITDLQPWFVCLYIELLCIANEAKVMLFQEKVEIYIIYHA